jgi:hypothetical protein
MAILRLVPDSGAPHEVRGDAALVGREAGCDVVVSDGSVSRKHARLERRAEGWTVIDQGSANGTFVDSQRVAEAVLRAGQEVRFGAVRFRVEIEADDIEATVVASPSPDATVAAPQLMVTPPLGVPTARPGGAAPPPPPTPQASPASSPGAPPPIPKAGPPPVPRPASAPPPSAPAPPRAGGPPSAPSAAGARDRFASRTPAAAAPVGQMPPPPVSVRKGKSPFFWMVTGCCGCLLLGVLLVGGIGGAALFATRAPAQAVQEQLAELRQGDVDAAYGRLSGDLQARLTREEFERLVQDHPGLKDNKDATFWSRSVSNDKARLSGVLMSRAGDVEQVTFELANEGGAWKVTGIQVGSSGTE